MLSGAASRIASVLQCPSGLLPIRWEALGVCMGVAMLSLQYVVPERLSKLAEENERRMAHGEPGVFRPPIR